MGVSPIWDFNILLKWEAELKPVKALISSTVLSVVKRYSIPLSCSSGLEGTDAKDFGMAVFKYKNGVSVAKSTAVEKGGYERRHLLVVGTKGTVELRPIETGAASEELFNAQKTTVRENFSEAFTSKAECYETEAFGRFDGMFRAFADYINGVKSNPYTYEYERKLHKVLLKACGK